MKLKILSIVKFLIKIIHKELLLWSSPKPQAHNFVLVHLRRQIKNRYCRNHYITMQYRPSSR